MTVATGRPPLPATAARPGRARRVGGWAAAAVGAGIAAGYGVGPELLVFGPLLLGVALALLGSTLPFLWVIVVTAGLGFGWLNDEALRLAGNTIHLNGLRWGLVLLAATAALVRVGLPPIPRHFRGYIAFLGLTTLGILWSPSLFEGLKHVLQYAVPLLVGLVAIRSIRSRADEDLLRRAFWIGFALAAVVGITLGIVGLGGGELLDEGRPIHRSTGPYLVAIMALALAAWRYRGNALVVLPAVVFVVALLTLSRATVLVMLGMIVLSAWGRPLRWYAGVTLMVVLVGALALQYEPFRDRVFGEDRGGASGGPIVSIQGQGEDAQLVVAEISTSGRGLIWLRTLSHSAEAPVIGHGTGSSVQYLVHDVALGVDHPHNDYLRVLHDHGVVGLLVFLAAAWMIARRMLRLHATAPDTRAREAALAGGLAFAGFLGIIVFDNALIFPVSLTQNLFILLVLAERAAAPGDGAAA